MKRLLMLSCLTALGAVSAVAHPGHSGPHQPEPPKPAVVVVEYTDFHCKPCADVSGLLDKLVRAKKLPLQVLFKHSPAHPDALLAHEAVVAAGRQGKFWEMHDLLFQNPKASLTEVISMARSLELDVKRFETALEDRTYRGEVMMDITEARGMGVRVTPTLFLNGTKLEGIDQIRSFVDTVLKPPQAAIDPNKIHEFDLAGSPSVGPLDAPVTLVEFSDFRCGFCGLHSRTVTELVAAYPGKIRRVFKHFPIQVNAEGKLPHQGAAAAMAQGKFWEMYAALMKEPLKGVDDLMARADGLGLDMERFQRDLAANTVAGLVQRDIGEGDRLGIRLTPTTFINGRILPGRQSLKSLTARVEAILNPGSEVNTADPVTVASPSLGPDDATALVEFFIDFANPECTKLTAILMEFRKENPDVRIEFKHYPARGNTTALRAHQLAMAAADQGRFRQMGELIVAAPTPIDDAGLQQLAARLRLDPERSRVAITEHRFDAMIAADIAQGDQRGLAGKPGLFLNGKRYEGSVPTTAALTELLGDDPCCAKRSSNPAGLQDASELDVDVFGSGGLP
jgi:protein-disulfide isomerase